jgi:NADPH2:quinone reductase
VGLATIQLAKRAGAIVLATASADDKLERLKSFGMDAGVNYVSADFVPLTLELTHGRGVDLVVDSIGGQTLTRSLECLVYRGRAITVGNLGRDTSLIDARQVMKRSLSLIGFHFPTEMNTDRMRALVARHLVTVRDGALRVVIDRRFPLREAAQAHAFIESRQAFGRVVLVP